MFIEPPSTEIVYQISEEKQRQILKDHFTVFYVALAESKLVPGAAVEEKDGVFRAFSGIVLPYHNAVLGEPKEEIWDQCIDEQLAYFGKAKVPFVWYLDEDADPKLMQRLLDRGFQDGGIFRGVLGVLDKPIPEPKVPEGLTLELVETESALEEFNELVCNTFGLLGESNGMVKQFLKEAGYHWLARKEGRPVSALTTLIEGDVVSFWNGASLAEIRRQGVSTALRHLALKDAISKGCHFGASYLMSEGLAYGICTKLGYQTKWRFRVFISPPQS